MVKTEFLDGYDRIKLEESGSKARETDWGEFHRLDYQKKAPRNQLGDLNQNLAEKTLDFDKEQLLGKRLG